jgi:cation diffusion facilitator CzcD-associated flavoprotein CzcO
MAATSLDGTIIMGAGQSGLAVDYAVKAMAVRAAEGVFKVETTHGTKTALSVVGATGANAVPYVPAPAARLAPGP